MSVAIRGNVAVRGNVGLNRYNILQYAALWLSDTGSDPATWSDISGNNNHVTQADAAKQPAIIAGGLNGRQIRRFDGGDFLQHSLSSFLDSPSQITVFAVAYGSVGSIGALVSKSGSTSAANGWRFYLNSSPDGQVLFRSNWGVLLGASGSNSDWRVMVGSYVSGEQRVVINGSVVGSGTSTTPAATNTNKLSIGVMTSGANGLVGDIAEIIVFPTALSTSDRQSVERYLSAKWNIPLT